MALFCIVFGVVIFVAFLLGGYVLASMLVAEGFWNMMNGAADFKFGTLFQLPTAQSAGTFVTCILVMGFLGLVIGMGVFTNGLILRRLNSLDRAPLRGE